MEQKDATDLLPSQGRSSSTSSSSSSSVSNVPIKEPNEKAVPFQATTSQQYLIKPPALRKSKNQVMPVIFVRKRR
ncbi:unnamed protein product [Cunninghamella blakesleeana]